MEEYWRLRIEASALNRQHIAENFVTIYGTLDGDGDELGKDNILPEAELSFGIGTTKWSEDSEQTGEEMNWYKEYNWS